MKILSLFDGVSCGYTALLRSGIKIDKYVAFEIDKYAISVSKYNYPEIEHRGNVVGADFSEFKDFDMVIGGFPCKDLSLCKNNRQGLKGKHSSLFWELARAIKEIKPKYFLVENNYGMPQTDFKIICDTLCCQPILINSALVSAQQRRRYYWTNIPSVTLPADRGILLKDILEDGLWQSDKAYAPTTRYQGAQLHNTLERHKNTMIAVPHKILNVNPSGNGMNGNVYYCDAKSPVLTTNKGEGIKIIKPVGAAFRTRNIDGCKVKKLEVNHNSKSYALTSAQTDSMCCEPIAILQRGRGFNKGGTHRHKAPTLTANDWPNNNKILIPVGMVVCISNQTTQNVGTVIMVVNGFVTIRDKIYPIKLSDGYYIIRKLTPIECERLQTLQDNFTAKGINDKGDEVKISNSQRYKMLGNGWTIEVIAHIFSHIKQYDYEINLK